MVEGKETCVEEGPSCLVTTLIMFARSIGFFSAKAMASVILLSEILEVYTLIQT
jgi:hypothetical protein